MGKPYRKLKDYEVPRVAFECVESGRWIIHPHAGDRLPERNVSNRDLREVLQTGKLSETRWKPAGKPP